MECEHCSFQTTPAWSSICSKKRDSPRSSLLTPPWLSRAAAWGAKLRRGARAAGRQDVQQGHREARPPGAGLQPGPAQLLVRAERAHADRHDRALRCVC